MRVVPSIEVRQLCQHVHDAAGTLRILDEIDFDIPAGQTVAITGSSGSGKSTLLGLMAGLDVPSSGAVRLLGHDLFTLDEEARAAIRAAHVGFVFQSFQLLPNLTALENVMLPLELAQRAAAQPAREMLARVGLGERLHHYPSTLSGGEQQRVALARAFVQSPQILFADEPTGSLDTATGEQIIELMFDLHRTQDTTLVLVTHEARLAARCQRVIHLSGGRMVEPGTAPAPQP